MSPLCQDSGGFSSEFEEIVCIWQHFVCWCYIFRTISWNTSHYGAFASKSYNADSESKYRASKSWQRI